MIYKDKRIIRASSGFCLGKIYVVGVYSMDCELKIAFLLSFLFELLGCKVGGKYDL